MSIVGIRGVGLMEIANACPQFGGKIRVNGFRTGPIVLLYERWIRFVIDDIDYLDPTPGRVLVRTGASPFCSTDCVNWRACCNPF